LTPGAYQPFEPARRPGGKPAEAPVFRVLVHRRHAGRYAELVQRVGLESAQQLWDHLAHAPGAPPLVNRSCVLRGKAGRPKEDGFSRTVHYEISGAARVDYQYNGAYAGGSDGDPHPVVWILAITFTSH